MKIQGSVLDESKYQKWGENVTYALFVNLKKGVIINEEESLGLFSGDETVENAREPLVSKGIFHNAVSFWLCVFCPPSHHLPCKP